VPWIERRVEKFGTRSNERRDEKGRPSSFFLLTNSGERRMAKGKGTQSRRLIHFPAGQKEAERGGMREGPPVAYTLFLPHLPFLALRRLSLPRVLLRAQRGEDDCRVSSPSSAATAALSSILRRGKMKGKPTPPEGISSSMAKKGGRKPPFLPSLPLETIERSRPCSALPPSRDFFFLVFRLLDSSAGLRRGGVLFGVGFGDGGGGGEGGGRYPSANFGPFDLLPRALSLSRPLQRESIGRPFFGVALPARRPPSFEDELLLRVLLSEFRTLLQSIVGLSSAGKLTLS